MVALHSIATHLKEMEANLLHVSQKKDRWIKITEDEARSSSNYTSETWLHMADSSHFIDEVEFVGMEKNKRLLTEWLVVKEPARSIITVWGMGGLGKTTLVTNVYKSERRNFDCDAWVSISQAFKTEDLIRAIIMELYEGSPETIPDDIVTMDHRRLKQTLRSVLQGKRYLIILDDVWSPNAFHDIAGALVDNEHGSRIVITTRIGEVASLAADNCKLELTSLEENEAWDLFCKRAFWKEKYKSCPQELQHWARKIVFRCQGLPLAIVSIGSLLSLREKTESEWKKVHDQLSWELDNNPNLGHMKHILNLSCKYLPRHLKYCFLYCSIFAEDYFLQRKRLIRLWIGEGFMEERGTYTLEEVAEDYLKELIHRCMLQVVQRNLFGRIKHCWMHDLVRELAISTAKKENFNLVCDNSEAARIGSEVRRLAVHRCNNDILLSMHLPRLRSIVVFDSTISTLFLSSASSNSRYLTVLVLQGIPIEKVPDEVGDLFNLRYLGLRRTKVKVLPKSLEKLHGLQTLDLMRTNIEKLPHCITKLKKLRHLFAEKVLYTTRRAFHNRRGVPAPKGLWNLRGLQTLQAMEASMGMVGGLGNLTQLRSFRIWKVRRIHCAQLCASIGKMRFLSKLDIIAGDENEELLLVDLNPPLQHLQKLLLKGRLEEELLKSFFQSLGCNLRKLAISWCYLREDPLPSLSHMSNLVVLWLQRTFNGQFLRFCEGWFPNLKEHYLSDMPQLSQVVIEKGAMERLDYLSMSDLGALKEVPQGIQFLTILQKLYLNKMYPEFRRWFDESDGRSKVQHIPNLIYIYERGGNLFRGNLLPVQNSQQTAQ